MEVRERFANEHAFDGMSISPNVRHGVVTLSGTVSSQAAKVLVTKEIEDVEGIKSVMNNLNVVGGTANASPGGTTARGRKDKKVILPWGTILPGHLSKEISSKTAKAKDVFHGTIASDVSTNGYILVPTGTPVQGTERGKARRATDWASIADDRRRGHQVPPVPVEQAPDTAAGGNSETPQPQ